VIGLATTIANQWAAEAKTGQAAIRVAETNQQEVTASREED
jgi:hypothetical protein